MFHNIFQEQSLLKKTLKTLWHLFMDGVQLHQGYKHFEEAVYSLLVLSKFHSRYSHENYILANI